MVGIKGITGVDPTPDRPSGVRDRKAKEPEKTTQPRDGVRISDEAKEAANTAKMVQVAKSSEEDIRAERVEAAKQNIEREDYKRREVVAKVAEKVSKYLP